MQRVPEHLWYQGPEQGDVTMRYLGTAGFVIEHDGHTVVLDPFITRPSLKTTALEPLVPNDALIRDIIPCADDVLIGHAHHDHVLDAPSLCRQTGARFIGSPDACNVARAGGVPTSQIRETRGREDIASGSGFVRGLPADHGRVYLGRIPLRGPIRTPPPWPPRLRDLRHGLVLNWYLELGGVRFVHIDSAEFFEEELDGFRADVLCLCAIGRRYRPDYVADAVRLLRPRVIVACHWDWFFTGYRDQPYCLPGVDLAGFVDEIGAQGVEAVVLPFNGVMGCNAC